MESGCVVCLESPLAHSLAWSKMRKSRIKAAVFSCTKHKFLRRPLVTSSLSEKGLGEASADRRSAMNKTRGGQLPAVMLHARYIQC